MDKSEDSRIWPELMAKPSRVVTKKIRRKKKSTASFAIRCKSKSKKNQPPTEKSRICTIRRPTPSLEKNKVMQALQCATNQKREKKPNRRLPAENPAQRKQPISEKKAESAPYDASKPLPPILNPHFILNLLFYYIALPGEFPRYNSVSDAP